jgi:hypothetical protein
LPFHRFNASRYPRPQLPPQHPVEQPAVGADDPVDAIDTAKVDINLSRFFDPHDGHSGTSSEA